MWWWIIVDNSDYGNSEGSGNGGISDDNGDNSNRGGSDDDNCGSGSNCDKCESSAGGGKGEDCLWVGVNNNVDDSYIYYDKFI